jgi:carboxyl-terminal processing protease
MKFTRPVGIGLAVIIVLVSFSLGQMLPRVVPAGWQIVGPRPLDFSDLNSTYETLKDKFDGNVDSGKVLDGARAGLVSSTGDPYTVYLDAKSAKELNDQLQGTLSGIGAEVGIKNNKLTVIASVDGSPAQKAGLRAGDVIALIDKHDTSSLTLDEAVAKIRGKAGSKVTLEILRGSSEPITLTITRDVINVPSVKWSMKPGNVGYIQITEFGSDTSDKIQQAASELKNQGAQKILLDLRDDPGGYLDAAVTAVSQFVPSGQVVVDERHGGRSQQKEYTAGSSPLAGLPVVVLMNGGSASASEITAGALRDDIGAKLIGTQSFGKGSVQEITNLAGGAELKITVAHWFTPKGGGIDKVGLKPDINVDKTQADTDAGRDPQLEAALAQLSK